MKRVGLLLLAGMIAACGAGCGGAQTFGLTSDDNNRAALEEALSTRKLPAQAGPRNTTGKPMVFAVLSGKPRKLVAFDLAAGETAWSVDADVQSRVEVGGDFVIAREGTQLVARNIRDGAARWKFGLAGEFVGASADADKAYLVTAQTAGVKPTWTLIALDGKSGGEAWRADAPGQLGTPAAQGGLVMSPFLKQWMSILDAQTGAPITRIRGIDEEIAFARVTSDAAWFGSAMGVFRLDERAASGQRADASYGTVALPKQLSKATWAPDGFDPVQAGYSAADRTRVLWRGAASGGDGPLVFQDGLIAVHYFRFVFGYTTTGELRWAYSHPRVELVASAHLGGVLGAVSAKGEVITLDPATGARTWQMELALETSDVSVLGATFDADGWVPEGGDAVDPGVGGTVEALVAIARDRDARFAEIKELAVSALASLPGKEVTSALLTMIQDERTPAKLRETAVDVLTQRHDATSLEVYAAALAVRTDYIAGTKAVAVGSIARVIAGLGGVELDPAARSAAVEALIGQLEDPQTENAALIAVVQALGAIGGGAELPALRRQLVAYRADPSFGSDETLIKAVVDGLIAHGGAADRETVVFVAEDAGSIELVKTIARAALGR